MDTIDKLPREHQHGQWISEVRAGRLGRPLPPEPDTDQVCRLDGYFVLDLPISACRKEL